MFHPFSSLPSFHRKLPSAAALPDALFHGRLISCPIFLLQPLTASVYPLKKEEPLHVHW